MKLYSYIFLFIFIWPVLALSKIQAVTTFTILEDFTRKIGGDKIEVTNLVPADSDPHIYEPTPKDVKKITKADLIFVNGLGFEGWIKRLIKGAGAKGEVIVCTEYIHPRLVFEDTLVKDPHAWHSIPHAKIYIRNIANALKKADPKNAAFYEKNTLAYLQELTLLDEYIRRKIDNVPPSKRKIITAHDAFGYFGNSYGIQMFAPQGISTESESKVHSIIDLIKQIKREKITTIFVERISDPKIVQQIGRETGAKIGGELYADGLSHKDGQAPNYIEMIKYNFHLILSAMR